MMTEEQRQLFVVGAIIWNTAFATFCTIQDTKDCSSGCPNFRAGFMFAAMWVSGLFVAPFVAIGVVFWLIGHAFTGAKP